MSGARKLSIPSFGGAGNSVSWLGTSNTEARFGDAVYAGIRTLDLRDGRVLSGEGDRTPSFPDLKILALRPRGSEREWIRPLFANAASVPQLDELRCCENHGDDILEILLDSPLCARLKRIDFTENLTNRGAELLHSNADRLESVERIWLGTTDRRRDHAERKGRVRNPNYDSQPGWSEPDSQRYAFRTRPM